MYAETPKEFYKTYRICIAHTKQAIIQMGIHILWRFCQTRSQLTSFN